MTTEYARPVGAVTVLLPGKIWARLANTLKMTRLESAPASVWMTEQAAENQANPTLDLLNVVQRREISVGIVDGQNKR